MLGLREVQGLLFGMHWRVRVQKAAAEGAGTPAWARLCHWSGLGLWVVELVESDKFGEKSVRGELEEPPPSEPRVRNSRHWARSSRVGAGNTRCARATGTAWDGTAGRGRAASEYPEKPHSRVRGGRAEAEGAGQRDKELCKGPPRYSASACGRDEVVRSPGRTRGCSARRQGATAAATRGGMHRPRHRGTRPPPLALLAALLLATRGAAAQGKRRPRPGSTVCPAELGGGQAPRPPGSRAFGRLQHRLQEASKDWP